MAINALKTKPRARATGTPKDNSFGGKKTEAAEMYRSLSSRLTSAAEIDKYLTEDKKRKIVVSDNDGYWCRAQFGGRVVKINASDKSNLYGNEEGTALTVGQVSEWLGSFADGIESGNLDKVLKPIYDANQKRGKAIQESRKK